MAGPVENQEDDLPPAPDAGSSATVDAATPEGVERQRRNQRKAAIAESEFVSDVLASARGRKFLFDILTKLGVFERRAGVSANGAYDPVLTGFHDGMRTAGVEFWLDWMRLDPVGVQVMLAENHATIAAAPKTPRGRKPSPAP